VQCVQGDSDSFSLNSLGKLDSRVDTMYNECAEVVRLAVVCDPGAWSLEPGVRSQERGFRIEEILR
jgi:hypothetical protein